MTREAIVSKTIKALSALPAEKAEEVADFASFLLKQYEDDLMLRSIEKIVENSSAFQFLADEEDIYTVEDIKVKH